jgi:hypothetical protein
MRGGTTDGQCTMHRRAGAPNSVPGLHERDAQQRTAHVSYSSTGWTWGKKCILDGTETPLTVAPSSQSGIRRTTALRRAATPWVASAASRRRADRRLRSRRYRRRPLLRGVFLIFRPRARGEQRRARLSPCTGTPSAADRDTRCHLSVACPGCDMDDTGHVRQDKGMGFAIVLGHGTLGHEANIFLPIRLDTELHRHSVDRLPPTVSHLGL